MLRSYHVIARRSTSCVLFFFNDTATTEIYTLSLHDALPISARVRAPARTFAAVPGRAPTPRSEEHTSELQSHSDLVCRLLLEKKKQCNSCQLHVGKKRPYPRLRKAAIFN